MDMTTVDLGPGATDKAGDEAVLWGRAAGHRAGGRPDRHHSL